MMIISMQPNNTFLLINKKHRKVGFMVLLALILGSIIGEAILKNIRIVLKENNISFRTRNSINVIETHIYKAWSLPLLSFFTKFQIKISILINFLL
jgi:hypothetical protein